MFATARLVNYLLKRRAFLYRLLLQRNWLHGTGSTPLAPLMWLGALKLYYEFWWEPGQLLLSPDVMDAGLCRVP